MTDLDKLKINRTTAKSNHGSARGHRRWPYVLLALIGVAAAAAYFSGRLGGAVGVETVAVVTAYPSQALAQLNATGYVARRRR